MKQRYGSYQLGELTDWPVHTTPEAATVIVTNKQASSRRWVGSYRARRIETIQVTSTMATSYARSRRSVSTLNAEPNTSDRL